MTKDNNEPEVWTFQAQPEEGTPATWRLFGSTDDGATWMELGVYTGYLPVQVEDKNHE